MNTTLLCNTIVRHRPLAYPSTYMSSYKKVIFSKNPSFAWLPCLLKSLLIFVIPPPRKWSYILTRRVLLAMVGTLI